MKPRTKSSHRLVAKRIAVVTGLNIKWTHTKQTVTITLLCQKKKIVVVRTSVPFKDLKVGDTVLIEGEIKRESNTEIFFRKVRFTFKF